MKNKIVRVLIVFMVFFSAKGFVSAKKIDVNDVVNEINKFKDFGVSARIDSQNNKIIISGGLMTVDYNDNYIEYNGRNHTNEYYQNNQDEKFKRSYLTDVIVQTISNLYGASDEDDYDQYGIQLEESDIFIDVSGTATLWSEIVYFKLPLDTDKISVSDDKNNGASNDVSDKPADDKNNGTSNDVNNTPTDGINNNTVPTKDIEQNNPNTGDNILIYIGAFVTLAIVSIVIGKKCLTKSVIDK